MGRSGSLSKPLNKNSLRQALHSGPLRGARALLGSVLTTVEGGITTSGMIVEVEAYDGLTDAACHAFKGSTKRCEIMFGSAGFCYVYFIYGMHYCVNVVTGKEGHGTAVLIRALEPLSGIETMEKRRGGVRGKQLTNGPAKLCDALSIDKRLLGEDLLFSRKIFLSPFKHIPETEIISTTRIGISKARNLPWRFYIKGNPFVSAL